MQLKRHGQISHCKTTKLSIKPCTEKYGNNSPAEMQMQPIDRGSGCLKMHRMSYCCTDGFSLRAGRHDMHQADGHQHGLTLSTEAKKCWSRMGKAFLPLGISTVLGLKWTSSGAEAPAASAHALAMPSKVTKRSPEMLKTSLYALLLPRHQSCAQQRRSNIEYNG